MVTLAMIATSTAGNTAITENRLTIWMCNRAAARPRRRASITCQTSRTMMAISTRMVAPLIIRKERTTALVGSYDTVAKALIDYAEIGCDLLSIRGWDVYEDAQDYARYVLPLVRQELAHREAAGTPPILNPDSTPELAARML